MNEATLAFDVRIESTREPLHKFGPPHEWWLLTGIEQALDHLVRLAERCRWRGSRLIHNA